MIDSLPIKHAFPRTLERWWKPGRTNDQTALLRLFESLSDWKRERLAKEFEKEGAIPGSAIRRAHQNVFLRGRH